MARTRYLARMLMPDCFLKGRHGPCSGPLDLHHWIKKQTIASVVRTTAWMQGASLKTADAEVYLAIHDDRNLSVLCRTHHERFHNKRFYVKRSELPAARALRPLPAVEDFARDFGLEAWLDRDYPKEAA